MPLLVVINDYNTFLKILLHKYLVVHIQLFAPLVQSYIPHSVDSLDLFPTRRFLSNLPLPHPRHLPYTQLAKGVWNIQELDGSLSPSLISKLHNIT